MESSSDIVRLAFCTQPNALVIYPTVEWINS